MDFVDGLVLVVPTGNLPGATPPMPAKDPGFMYQRGLEDLDGHLWELFHMDMDAMPA